MSPRWPTTGVPSPREAAALQLAWRSRVVQSASFDRKKLRLVAGVDVSVRADRAYAAACLFRFPELELEEEARVELEVEFPYVPGLLGFREVPALGAALARLRRRPEIVLVDGHGLAHPRGFGVATHLGVELDVPTIGCAKSLLVGEHRDPASRRGSRAFLRHDGAVIGCALRTRAGVRPLYVSIGHKIDLATAIAVVMKCGKGYRMPEPTRRADWLAGRI